MLLGGHFYIAANRYLLIPYVTPHMHHQEVGLWATRQLSQLLFPFQIQAMTYS